MWLPLIANFAVAALFISLWAQSQDWLQRRSRRTRSLLFGCVLGAGAMASMALAVELSAGTIVDLRSTMISVSGFLGGPLAGLITGLLAAAGRITIAGDGTLAGLVGILLSTSIGGLGHLVLRGRSPSLAQIVLFAAIASLMPFAAFAFTSDAVREMALRTAGLPMLVISFASTCIAAMIILRSQHQAEERDLLRNALSQAPDFLYVKDAQSRFVTANHAVARQSGLADPAHLRGKSDFDIVAPERATPLFAAEQELLRSGAPLLEYEERVVDQHGVDRWYATSKAPLHNAAGETIGLAGVTRDITEQKAIESALTDSRNQLSFVLTEMSDGLALFDDTAHIAFCNQQYRDMFPRTGALRTVGAYLPDVLRAAIDSGEQIDIPADKVNRWIAGIMQALKTGADEEVHMFDGRWLHIRTKPLANGGATVVVSDISTIKRAEAKLMVLTEQLKLLATTDGLTSLLNRRAFDECLDKELARSRRTHQPISLIMIDIDKFKAFNDLYGHPAGDECIRRVASVVRTGMRRPADLVARYGGEELCVVLPETDEDGAYFLAEDLRLAVRAMGLEHRGSEKGVVTISLGVATFTSGEVPGSALDLVTRADEALYVAKGAGRDRVAGWTQHSLERRPAAG